MASVMCLHFSMQMKDNLEHIDVDGNMSTLSSTCRSLYNISMHLITLLNILMRRY